MAEIFTRDRLVADFDGISIKYFVKVLDQGKCLSINLRKVFPMFVLMFLLKGGLNQIMFLFLFHFFGRLVLNSRSAVCPEVLRAFSYSVLALLKISSFAELSDNLWLTDVGILLNDGPGMIRRCVDVEQFVIFFFVWSIGFFSKVESYVKEIYFF